MIKVEEVKNLSKLARINLSNKEITRLQKDISSILDYFNKIEEVNLVGVEPINHSVGLENVLREDLNKKIDIEINKNLLKLAPSLKDRFIKVKSIL